MKLTINDFQFINFLINLNKKKISYYDFPNLKEPQVKYKIDKINYLLKLKGKGVILKKYGNFYINNLKDLSDLYSTLEVNAFDKKQRMNMIVNKLVEKNYIKIKELENLFSQSKTSVKSDIKDIREMLKNNSLTLEYDKKSGLVIVGQEKRIRLFFLNYFFKNYDFFKEKIELRFSKYLVFSMLKGKNSSFETSKILTVLISVQYFRIKTGNKLKNMKDNFFDGVDYSDHKIKKFIKFLRAILSKEELEAEKNFILFFLAGLCYSEKNSITLKREKEFKNNLTSSLAKIGEIYKLEIEKDKVLLKNLESHLKIALFKLYYKIPIVNSSVKEAFENYGDLLLKIKLEFKNFEKNFKVKITDEELTYIYFHIKSSLIRLSRKKEVEKKVLIVCNLGIGAAEILKFQLEKNFIVKIIDVISFYQFQVYKIQNIDFIVHTVDSLETTLPSIKVNPLLTSNDIKNIEKLNFIKI